MSHIKRKYLVSEVTDEWGNGEATQVHHIFMKSEYPQISYYYENLIKLTPTQHFTKAHPSNNTQVIHKQYQYICLIAKSVSIEKSIKNKEDLYSYKKFIHVINTGLDLKLNLNADINEVRRKLSIYYNIDS